MKFGQLGLKLLVVVFILIFTLFKWGDLDIPFFWDEAGSYVDGVLFLLNHQIFFHPSAIDPMVSFGHPILLHYFLAVLAKTFGFSIPLLRGTLLFLSVLTIFGMYVLSLKLIPGKRKVALFAVVLLIAQPIFYTQSTLVLLEIPLAFCSVWAIYFYVKRQFFIASIFVCFAVLVKETGIVLGLALLTDYLFRFFWFKGSVKFSALQLTFLLLPFLVMILYYLEQYKSFGWYLNPANMSTVKLGIKTITDNFYFYFFEIIFIDQGRFLSSIILLFVLVINFRCLFAKATIHKFISDYSLVLIYSLGFVAFSSLLHNLERYYVVLFPFWAILLTQSVFTLHRINRVLPFVIMLCLVAIGISKISSKVAYSEANMSYTTHVRTAKTLLNEINNGDFKDDSIFLFFPINSYIKSTSMGYLNEVNFHATNHLENANYFFISQPGGVPSEYFDTTVYKVVKEFRSEESKALLVRPIVKNYK